MAGVVRPLESGRVSLIYAHANGAGGLWLDRADLPEALQPTDAPVQEASRDVLEAHAVGAGGWLLTSSRVQRLVSAPVPETDARLWIGLRAPDPVPADAKPRLESLARDARAVLTAPPSAEEAARQLSRLEQAAALLPTLLHVLDVREVFDRLSAMANTALPHDRLLLRLFSDDCSQITVYAGGSGSEEVLANRYPAAITRAWSFDLVDDLSRHPFERDQPPAMLGARSVLRVPIRFADRAIGGLGFLSVAPGRYSTDDVAIGQRLADIVAVGLSHQRLAEQGRRDAALRERSASLEMLDGLLATLTGVLDIREVFDRVSAVARKVLPHDALSIAEVIDDPNLIRIHASHGLGDLPQPYDVPIPEPSLRTALWDYRLIDDARERPEYAPGPGVAAGMRSMMFVSIKLGGRMFGGLNFYSKTPGRYTKDDVLVARRITDHVALALSHKELADQARRSEALRARAEKADLLDAVLATITGTAELRTVFDHISRVTQQVVPHDTMLVVVNLPGGERGQVYAIAAPESGRLPDIVAVPPIFRENPDFAFEVVADLQTDPTQRQLAATQKGYRSALRVPIRVDNEFVAALAFLSFTPARYSDADAPAAARIAERIALSLARERGAVLLKQADEASARAARLEARVRALTDELDARTGYRRVVGGSLAWKQVLTLATQVAPTDTTVLLLGESGTGKEVVARFLHRASTRSGGPFIALNCAALPEQLLEAELFGYERGAFTGATQSKPGQLELAAGGTLFLDEVGEMSPSAQAKFLRVLQEREFTRLGGTRTVRTDARIVAATNRDLLRAIANNQFREDLYYRLNVFAIPLPALRDRRDDILPLSEAFLSEVGKGIGRPPGGISRDARQRLLEYHWPGNVRELRNILERAAILCDGGLITSEHLAFTLTLAATATPRPAAEAPTVDRGHAGGASPANPSPPLLPVEPPPAVSTPTGDLNTMERLMIEQALNAAKFNKSKAAKALGLTRHQLYVRMRKHGLE
jgi:formate hydrogenlyase transcriptional activator